MSSYYGITVEHLEPAIAVVRLNRPPHNFIEHPLVSAIADVYEALGADGQTRVIVLAAEGKNFCSGANFGGPQGDGGDQRPRKALPAETVFLTYSQGARIMAAPLPVVAAVRGAAVGGGLGLACTADFRVGSPSTRLVPNFAQLGVHHGFGLTVTLPRLVGEQRANELLLVGRRISGEEGHALGLLDRFSPDEALDETAIAFAREIASAAPLAMRSIRATMRQGLADRFRAAAQHESQQQDPLGDTEDFVEGVRASAERRPPVFMGR